MSRKEEDALSALSRQFGRRYDKKVKAVLVDAKAAQGGPIEILNRVWKDNKMDQFISVNVAITAAGGLVVAGFQPDYARSPEAQRKLLRSTYGRSKRPMFKTLAERTPYKAALNEVKNQIIANGGVLRAANKLAKIGDFTRPTTNKIVDELISAVRNAQGPEAAKAAIRLKKYAQRLAQDPKAPSAFLKKAYINLADKANAGNQVAIEKSIERALSASAKYNAQRIARTEAAAAYGQAKREEMMNDPTVGGSRFLLDASHRIVDECDFYAQTDLYGLGPGIFPKDEGPILPIHPNGLSTYVPISIDDIKDPGAKMRPDAARLADEHKAGKRIDLEGHIRKYTQVFNPTQGGQE
jgi:hypothetical protein